MGYLRGMIPSEQRGAAAAPTTAQVAKIAGVAYSTLADWARTGLVDVKRPKCRREGYAWSAKHVHEIRVVADLRRLDVPMQKIRDSMRLLRSMGHNPYSTGKFLVISKGHGRGRKRVPSLVKVCDSGEVIEIIGRHRGQYVLPLWSEA